MNGINDIDKDDLPLVKRRKQMRLLKVRFLIIVFFSNLFIFLLTFHFNDSEINQEEDRLSFSEVLGPDYTLISIPLTSFIDQGHHLDFVDITILDQEKRVIVKHAQLISQQNLTKEENLLEQLSEEKNAHFYTIKILKSDLERLIKASSQKLFAWPYFASSYPSKGNQYEITF